MEPPWKELGALGRRRKLIDPGTGGYESSRAVEKSVVYYPDTPQNQ
jgi:hypothetical protein